MQCNGMGYAWANEDECSVTELGYSWANEDECSVTKWVTPGLTRINEV